jgi:hypothetical protein
MMNDREFFELELRMMIVPHQARWPAPEHVHWAKLHAVADEARERVTRAHRQMDEIDRNSALSPEDKGRQRRKVADEALAAFDASKTLVRALEAVRYITTDAELKALEQAEAGWQRAIDLIVERAAQTKAPDRRRNPPWGVYSKSSLPHGR